MHDPRMGRFFAVDPFMHKYPWYSSYQFAGNSPIVFIDLEGLERYYAGDGSLIAQWGWNPLDIRVVPDKNVSDHMKNNLEKYNDRSTRDAVSQKAKPLDVSETVYYGAIEAVRAGGKLYQRLAENTDDPTEKAAYTEANDLLMDFAAGSGPYLRIYENNDPMTTLLNKGNRVVKEVVDDFEKRLKKTNSDMKSFFDTNTEFTGGYEFSPDHAIEESGWVDGLRNSVNEHLEAITENPLAIVIGGMSYMMTPTFDANGDISGFDIELSNISGKGSLLLHQATDIKDLDNQNVPLSNKKQVFRIHITIDDYNESKQER